MTQEEYRQQYFAIKNKEPQSGRISPAALMKSMAFIDLNGYGPEVEEIIQKLKAAYGVIPDQDATDILFKVYSSGIDLSTFSDMIDRRSSYRNWRAQAKGLLYHSRYFDLVTDDLTASERISLGTNTLSSDEADDEFEEE